MTETAARESFATLLKRHVGLRIRLRRTFLGMTQERLGEVLGITRQQVQNHESGVDRVPNTLLTDMARLFGVSIAFFNEQQPVEGAEWSAPIAVQDAGFAEAMDGFGGDRANRLETQELLRAYNNIADPDRRSEALELLKSLA